MKKINLTAAKKIWDNRSLVVSLEKGENICELPVYLTEKGGDATYCQTMSWDVFRDIVVGSRCGLENCLYEEAGNIVIVVEDINAFFECVNSEEYWAVAR